MHPGELPVDEHAARRRPWLAAGEQVANGAHAPSLSDNGNERPGTAQRQTQLQHTEPGMTGAGHYADMDTWEPTQLSATQQKALYNSLGDPPAAPVFHHGFSAGPHAQPHQEHHLQQQLVQQQMLQQRPPHDSRTAAISAHYDIMSATAQLSARSGSNSSSAATVRFLAGGPTHGASAARRATTQNGIAAGYQSLADMIADGSFGSSRGFHPQVVPVPPLHHTLALMLRIQSASCWYSARQTLSPARSARFFEPKRPMCIEILEGRTNVL